MSGSRYRPVAEPNVWCGDDFRDSTEWVVELAPAMIDELAKAARQAVAEGLAPDQLAPATFRLPGLAGLIDDARQVIENGRGFLMLRGWPAVDHSRAESLAAFCGFASHFGTAMVQNYEGESIVDVTDKERPYDRTSRGYMSNKRLPFHSDGADIVGLLCLGVPAAGGTSLLLSATKLYNTILEERPHYIETLTRGFFHHRRGQHEPGQSPVSADRIPVFAFSGGLLHCCYNRNPIDWVVHEGIALSDHEIAVLDYLDSVCHRTGMALAMEFQCGDMQFVNNSVILHSRTEYRDGESHRRHLVRLWLENPRNARSGRGLLDVYVPGTSRFSRERSAG